MIDPHTLEPVPDELRPAGLFASASGREYYSRILRVLENAGGYVPGVAGEAVADGKRRYYILHCLPRRPVPLIDTRFVRV